jgi:hypothetical protein
MVSKHKKECTMNHEIEKLFDRASVEVKRKHVPHKKMVVHALDDKSRNSYSFVQENAVLVSFVSVVFLPYILGMLIALILFYFYIGISVVDFFHVYSGLSQLVFWVLGLYIIITLIDIWLILKKVFGRV